MQGRPTAALPLTRHIPIASPQAVNWVKLAAGDRLVTLRMGQPDLVRQLETAIPEGKVRPPRNCCSPHVGHTRMGAVNQESLLGEGNTGWQSVLHSTAPPSCCLLTARRSWC